MNSTLARYRERLELTPLTEEFFKWCVDTLGLNRLHGREVIFCQLDPWFGTLGDNRSAKDPTQYVDSRVHQKYRIALEFCAAKAGFRHIVGFVPDGNNDLRQRSGNAFWFRGSHPGDVHWILVGRHEREVLTGGIEKPGALTYDTLNAWLEERIKQFRGCNGQQTTPMEGPGA